MAFVPFSAAGGGKNSWALLRLHYYLLYPSCFPQSRDIGILLRVFVRLWHASSYGLDGGKASNCHVCAASLIQPADLPLARQRWEHAGLRSAALLPSVLR